MADVGEFGDGFDAKVRNQIRKGQKNGLSAQWGGEELLPEFYDVFSRNMRDLGTPVYGRELFRSILRQFPGQAELCVVRAGGASARAGRVAAAGLLLHGHGVTEVPSASSLKEFKRTNANMLLYWNLLQRAIERGQSVFDFGRSTPEGGTFHFKKQWGARPEPPEGRTPVAGTPVVGPPEHGGSGRSPFAGRRKRTRPAEEDSPSDPSIIPGLADEDEERP